MYELVSSSKIGETECGKPSGLQWNLAFITGRCNPEAAGKNGGRLPAVHAVQAGAYRIVAHHHPTMLSLLAMRYFVAALQVASDQAGAGYYRSAR
jgi:hypothetical protein